MRKSVSLIVLALIALSSLLSANLVLAQGGETPQVVIDACQGQDPDTIASYQGEVYRCGDVVEADEVLLSTPVPGDEAEVPSETAVRQFDLTDWVEVPFVQFFDVFAEVDGQWVQNTDEAPLPRDVEKWVLPLGTSYAVSTSNGFYEAIPSAPAGPQSDGSDAGWCAPDQFDCPPHLYLVRVTAPNRNDLEVDMDISYRMFIEAEDVPVRMQFALNTATRTPEQLLEDYDSLASGGGLGLFLSMKDSLMEEATLLYNNENFVVGSGVWDALPDTAGRLDNIVPLDDPSISHFGQEGTTTAGGDSLYPAYVVPIPAPGEDPQFSIDLLLDIPAGSTIVVWLGRYDVTTESTSMDATTCTVTPAGDKNVNVREIASVASPAIGNLRVGQSEQVRTYTDGWFELVEGGFVSQAVVSATGCEALVSEGQLDPEAVG